jgi:hypothetical protein
MISNSGNVRIRTAIRIKVVVMRQIMGGRVYEILFGSIGLACNAGLRKRRHNYQAEQLFGARHDQSV